MTAPTPGLDPFAFDEATDLSDDARAILAYARKWGTPFTRVEITDVAPGAAWDPYSRWPSTVAKLDPIRELVRAGLVEEHDEQPVKSDRRGRKTYKRWRLTGVDVPPSLAELLNELIDKVSRDEWCDSGAAVRGVETVRDEILRRFGRPGSAS